MAKGDKFYFENFVECANLAKKASNYLVECLESYDASKIETMLKEMHSFEHSADNKKHEMNKALAKAHEMGLRFDGWDEHFHYEKWLEAFEAVGIDPSFYANREFGEEELLPWDNIDIGVTKEFFLRERHRAYAETTTKNCRLNCNGCGANQLGGERSCCPSLKK